MIIVLIILDLILISSSYLSKRVIHGHKHQLYVCIAAYMKLLLVIDISRGIKIHRGTNIFRKHGMNWVNVRQVTRRGKFINLHVMSVAKYVSPKRAGLTTRVMFLLRRE